MNYNANLGAQRQGPARKIRHVSHLSANEQTVQNSQHYPQPEYNLTNQQQPGLNIGAYDNYTQKFNYGYPQGQSNIQPTQYPGFDQVPELQPSTSNKNPNFNITGIPSQFTMLQQPIVQDMAIEYGQKLADQGKQLVESHIEKWIPITRLKYYFAVDNKYVINKLRLIIFPFIHKDWSLKYDQDSPVQPRYDINAPDLYIPVMAYITYVVLAGLMLGMQNKFSPEQLGIQASSALAYTIFELVIYTMILYICNISTTLKSLDLISFCGYKFTIINACILISILFKKTGYYISLIYLCLSLGFFLLRTLKAKVLHDPVNSNPTDGSLSYDSYGPPQQKFDYSIGRKRKLYFLFLVAGIQSFLTFWLSMHLIPSTTNIT